MRYWAMETPALTIMIVTVSLLYATAWQAGGTAFLAITAFASF